MQVECASDFNQRLDALTKDANRATFFIGFLKATIGNENLQVRLNDSDCGYMVETARICVKDSVILYCSRAWESGHNDMISLPNLHDRFLNLDEFRVIKKSQKFCAFESEYEKTKSLPVKATVRVMRSERLAHRISKSSDRDNFEKEGIDVDKATYDDLTQFAEKTVFLVNQFASFSDRGTNLTSERIQRTTEWAKELFRLIPVLKDVENPSH